MSKGAFPRPWLSWLPLVAFAACLNPHPDDEPTVVTPSGQDPGTSPSGASANETPPVLIGGEQDDGQQSEPTEGPPREVADAGAPPDAGVTSADAGPSVSH